MLKKLTKQNKFIIILLLVAILGLIAIFLYNPLGKTYNVNINKTIKIEQKYGGKNKQVVIHDLKLAKKYNHFIPFTPVGNFNGQLKKLGTVKIVFGISGNSIANYYETFGNINYILRYTKFHNEKTKIKVVIYGAMVRQIKPNYGSHVLFKKMAEFYKEGVRFYACYNAMMINGLVKSSIPYFVKPVPMGSLKIYILQKKGYIYMTNP
jgi:hypothetical protein